MLEILYKDDWILSVKDKEADMDIVDKITKITGVWDIKHLEVIDATVRLYQTYYDSMGTHREQRKWCGVGPAPLTILSMVIDEYLSEQDRLESDDVKYDVEVECIIRKI